MKRTEYLVDLLGEAEIDAPGEQYVDVERMILAREVETAVFQHPPATVTFPPMTVGRNGRLSFACGIKQAAWSRIKSPVRFTIVLATSRGRHPVFATRLNPRIHQKHRAWQKHEIDLSRYEGQSVRITLRTHVEWRRSTEYAWAGWANPRITHEVNGCPSVSRVDRHRHVFLITADALSARYLPGYGHPKTQTPNLDQMAAEGVLFEDAWAQSCMTFGSYVSILTGVHPHEHGVSKEWETFPLERVSLPRVLSAEGYESWFVASSRELSGRNNRLGQIFDEFLPTLSNPMQDGAITTRHFINRFERRPDKPMFCWLHYFDVHPPSMPPAPFNSMYYAHNPADRRREYLSAEIPRIGSVESVLIMRTAMPILEKGRPVAEVMEVLEDTAAVLKGESVDPPDLAEHVLSLGKRATQGKSPPEFGRWLSEQAHEMAGGRGSRALLNWLKEVTDLLEHTEADIKSWLTDVVDFRYPLSMYWSNVSYFDRQVGALAAYLKERKLYDQSLIVITAPHGEILQHETLPYQHFLLTPDTLHVPLVMKLPAEAQLAKQGSRLRGVFDLIDLFPTTLDILGIKNAFALSGTSRWNQIQNAEDIPAHDSFAAGLHQLAQSVCRPPYLLARNNPRPGMETFQTIAGGGREVLYDLVSGEVYRSEFPEAVAGLREALAAKFKISKE